MRIHACMLWNWICATLFRFGGSSRGYTFIDDMVAGIRAAMDHQDSPREIFNLGNHSAVSMLEMVATLAEALEIGPILKFLPEQPGDVPRTYADITKPTRLLSYRPATSFTGRHSEICVLAEAGGAIRFSRVVRGVN
jgi:nucleoside-diphosphate-sugar epimerase